MDVYISDPEIGNPESKHGYFLVLTYNSHTHLAISTHAIKNYLSPCLGSIT